MYPDRGRVVRVDGGGEEPSRSAPDWTRPGRSQPTMSTALFTKLMGKPIGNVWRKNVWRKKKKNSGNFKICKKMHIEN